MQQHEFARTANPLHFLTLLFPPQFGLSLLHDEKRKKISTWITALVPKYINNVFSIALCTVLILVNSDQLWLPVIMVSSLILCMLDTTYCRLSMVIDLKAESEEFTLCSSENSLCAPCFQTNMHLKKHRLKLKSRFITSVKQKNWAKWSPLT